MINRGSLLILAICLLATCSSRISLVDNFKIGFSADENDRFFITHAVIDDGIRLPVGNIGCCIGDAGAVVGGFSSIPRHLSLQWIDREYHHRFFAHIDFPLDLSEQLASLPQYYVISQKQQQSAKAYLIVSIDKQNRINSWLSNARSEGDNIQGRVLILLGSETGTLISSH